jgi:predicted DsbA family dithiol-disulfide isomerase
MEMHMQPLKIEVVADVVCPWCYLGWARLQEALKLRPDVQAEISWRTYQLRPAMPQAGEPYRKLMEEKFGAERLKEIRENMTGLGRDHGLDFQFDRIEKSPNTANAHRLILWAAQENKLDAVAMGVMRAYFTEGKFIGDENVLAGIGAAAGMDKAALLKKFASPEGRDILAADAAKNAAEGVTAVPCYLLGGKVRVDGSYPPEELAAEIDKALQKAA